MGENRGRDDHTQAELHTCEITQAMDVLVPMTQLNNTSALSPLGSLSFGLCHYWRGKKYPIRKLSQTEAR